jgi:hypothetical protein
VIPGKVTSLKYFLRLSCGGGPLTGTDCKDSGVFFSLSPQWQADGGGSGRVVFHHDFLVPKTIIRTKSDRNTSMSSETVTVKILAPSFLAFKLQNTEGLYGI